MAPESHCVISEGADGLDGDEASFIGQTKVIVVGILRCAFCCCCSGQMLTSTTPGQVWPAARRIHQFQLLLLLRLLNDVVVGRHISRITDNGASAGRKNKKRRRERGRTTPQMGAHRHDEDSHHTRLLPVRMSGRMHLPPLLSISHSTRPVAKPAHSMLIRLR